jgi:hypothetical protein
MVAMIMSTKSDPPLVPVLSGKTLLRRPFKAAARVRIPVGVLSPWQLGNAASALRRSRRPLGIPRYFASPPRRCLDVRAI